MEEKLLSQELLEISSNDLLTSLVGLSSLASVGGDLEVDHNDFLFNLDGLSDQTSVTGALSIHDNLQLCQSLVDAFVSTPSPMAYAQLVDDLLATGGTAAAAAKLVRKVGAEIVEIGFLIELSCLKGREKLNGHPIHSVITY